MKKYTIVLYFIQPFNLFGLFFTFEMKHDSFTRIDLMGQNRNIKKWLIELCCSLSMTVLLIEKLMSPGLMENF